jgi:hypothetical protein
MFFIFAHNTNLLSVIVSNLKTPCYFGMFISFIEVHCFMSPPSFRTMDYSAAGNCCLPVMFLKRMG